MTFLQGRLGGKESERLRFDDFVRSCAFLKAATDMFKPFDEDRDGYATVSFEELLSCMLSKY